MALFLYECGINARRVINVGILKIEVLGRSRVCVGEGEQLLGKSWLDSVKGKDHSGRPRRRWDDI